MMERVLIVGYGSIGQRHLRIVRESLPQADLRILRRSDSKAVEGTDGCFASLDQALAFKPQAAIIASPSPFHIDTALALGRQGCHLLVEKPLSDRMERVPLLLAAAREHGIVLQVGYNLRFQPSLRDFRQQAQSGRIGRILSIRGEAGQHLEGWRPGTDYRMGVSARYELGGGVLLELSHELDYLRWIFGEAQWVSAWTGHQSSLEIDVEDTAHLLLGMAGNGQSIGASAPVVALTLDFLRRDTVRRCTAVGETGSLVWDGVLGTVQLYTPDGGYEPVSQHPPVRDQTYREQWQHFLDCVRQGTSPLVSGYDGLAVLKLIQAARHSAATDCTRVWINRIEPESSTHG